MVIIYGGIQPDGLVLSIHTVTIDTSKRNRSTVLPGLTTPRPTFPPSPPPIRGTVPPLSKWAPYERANPRKSSLPPPPIELSTQSDAKLRDWARMFGQFKVNEDDLTVTTHKTLTSTTTPLIPQPGIELATGSPINKVGTVEEATLPSKQTSQFSLSSNSPRLISHKSSLFVTESSSSAASSTLMLESTAARVQSSSTKKVTTEKISLENLLLQTLDKLANQYRKSSGAHVKK